MNERYCADAWICLDGDNPPFLTYIAYEEAQNIQDNGGLKFVERVNFVETPERQIPHHLKDGLAQICDIWVVMRQNVAIFLN